MAENDIPSICCLCAEECDSTSEVYSSLQQQQQSRSEVPFSLHHVRPNGLRFAQATFVAVSWARPYWVLLFTASLHQQPDSYCSWPSGELEWPNDVREPGRPLSYLLPVILCTGLFNTVVATAIDCLYMVAALAASARAPQICIRLSCKRCGDSIYHQDCEKKHLKVR